MSASLLTVVLLAVALMLLAAGLPVLVLLLRLVRRALSPAGTHATTRSQPTENVRVPDNAGGTMDQPADNRPVAANAATATDQDPALGRDPWRGEMQSVNPLDALRLEGTPPTRHPMPLGYQRALVHALLEPRGLVQTQDGIVHPAWWQHASPAPGLGELVLVSAPVSGGPLIAIPDGLREGAENHEHAR